MNILQVVFFGVTRPAISLIIFLCVISSNTMAGKLPTPNTFGGDFTFDSTLNKKVSISDWKGKVVLVNFGFTSCPDVCPLILSKLSLVQNIIDKKEPALSVPTKTSEKNLSESLQVIFVTVDPERDSIEKMRSYLNNFHHTFVGMRSEAEYSQVLRRYGASSQQETVNGTVEVSHTDYVYVINKEGHVAGYYDIKENYQVIVDAVKDLL